MRTLVTGGAGFIGHYLVKKLLEQGDNVRVIDDFSKGEAKNLEPFMNNLKFEFIEGDIIDFDVLKKAVKGVDIIYHLAAKIGGIGYFHKIPGTLLRDNEKMTLNVFEVAKEEKQKVIYLSSSMVYENARKFPSDEEHLKECPPPITAYGFSKLAGEYIAKAYQNEFGIPYVIVRPFNAYGPGEAPGDYVGYAHVIPDFVKKMLNTEDTIEILGSGEQTRCFTHARDIADAIALVGKNSVNDDFNIGTSDEIRMIDLARRIWKILGKNKELKFKHVESYKDDVLRRVPDCSKIKNMYGWQPKIPIETGLKETVEWIKEKINRQTHKL